MADGGWSGPDLGAHRAALLRYAELHVRDAATAEDLVQATLLAALSARESFRGDSAARTWLVGILRNKIVDHYRARFRSPLVAAPPEAELDAELADGTGDAFTAEGGWTRPPSDWGDPERSLESDGFWQALEACLRVLPGVTGKVFVLRELLGLEPEEICGDLALSRSNYWVLMHRARLRLRQCLERRWLGAGAEG